MAGYSCQTKNKRFFVDRNILPVFFRVCLWFFQGLLAQPLTQQVGGYLNLLSPVLDLIGFVCLEIAILIFFLNLRANLEYINPFQKFISQRNY